MYEACISFLKRLLRERLRSYFADEVFDESVLDTGFIDQYSSSPIFQFKQRFQLAQEEVILLLIALSPHLDPAMIDRQVSEFIKDAGDLPEIGGVRGKNYRGFIPTIQTVLFLTAGSNIRKSIEVRSFLRGDHPLVAEGIIVIGEIQGEPFTSSTITIPEDFVEFLLTGKMRIPDYSASFPARRLETRLIWDDLVVSHEVRNGIEDILSWMRNGSKGYKCLFHGPSGTGKTTTAVLIGKMVNVDVFQVDIGMLVSKYISETEKNIDNLFRLADRHRWILLVDDADKLFGKDEMGYFLQSIYSFAGIVFFETRDIDAISEGFLRRLKSDIHFPLPSFAERKVIWNIYLPRTIYLDPSVNIDEISEKYILSGRDILQICEDLSIRAVEKGDNKIRQEDIVQVVTKRFKSLRFSTGPEDNPKKKEVKVFISYSSKDRALKNMLIDGLSAHLSNKASIQYSFWDDRQIDMGSNWQEEIDKALHASDVAIILVSANFAASSYIQQNELGAFLKRQKEKGYLILPVLLRSYDFSDFEKLSKLNFFKTYYSDYGINHPVTRHQVLPFDILGDDPHTTDKQFNDFYFRLADHVHTAVTSHVNQGATGWT